MTVPWHYHDGETALQGEILHPNGNGNGKAVLVVHEADGIGGNVRRHGQMLAALGYTAALADMHGKGRPLTGEEIGPALDLFLADRAFLRRRVRSACDGLVADHGFDLMSIAAIGYCFGGTAVLELARSGAGVAVVASFHGLLTTAAPAAPGTVKARVLACTGALDPLVPLSSVAEFQAEMAACGADWQLAVFGRALHSFTNSDVGNLGDERMAFDPEAEEVSWTILLKFLHRSFAMSDHQGSAGVV